MEAHEVGRGVDVGSQAPRLQDCPHEGDGRALAVGAGDVNHRRQPPLGMIQGREQALDAPERQVDRARMQGEEARHQRVGGFHLARRPSVAD